MGAQIAAHLAAAGVRVHLLDLESDEPIQDPKKAKLVGKQIRNQRAILGMAALSQLKPSPLMSESLLSHIIPGNFADDLAVVADADWVIEAVVERLDVKKKIHLDVSRYVRPGTPVCTNTSGIPLQTIVDELPESYATSFFGTHFFNPPRYMHLLEIIPHNQTDQELIKNLALWIDEHLGKGIVWAYDTVNFIANRIGVLTIQSTIRNMVELGLNIETVDALTGKLMGRPASGTFRTADVVGLDTYAHVAKNVYDRAPQDPYRDLFLPAQWMAELIEAGNLGQKSNDKGCYAKSSDASGKRQILAYRPGSKTYEAQKVAEFPWQAQASTEKDTIKRLRLILSHKDAGAELIWRTLRDTFSYSALLVEEIAGGSLKSVDDAIRWGFNWEWGPFELWQALGYDLVLNRMLEEGCRLPNWAQKGLEFYKPAPQSSEWSQRGYREQLNPTTASFDKLSQQAHQFFLPKTAATKDPRIIAANPGASLLDIGDGIALLNFHTKMNAIDLEVLEMIQRSVGIVSEKFSGLVIANDGPAFSAGANLKYLLQLINEKNWNGVDHMIRQFQGSLQLLKYAPFPSVACPFGMTLGGGCEVALHASYRMASSETYAGLVEIGVGLLPAGGGTKELALRAYGLAGQGENVDPLPFLQKMFMLIGMAKVSGSGFEAMDMGLLPDSSYVVMSKERLVQKAKAQAFHMASLGYRPPSPALQVKVPGDAGVQTFRMILQSMVQGRTISEYDAYIGERIATVLCGGEINSGSLVSEKHFLNLERTLFVELCQQEKTQQRIEHMLKTGKPLRN
jgi:3-hydroxyacyl-CoA dehydrogenase